mmetsp:Transcript_16500/g.37773  ORF Transcript_16500/g.37773 Transcript_16500/m.37773 type:complete len:384 (+) Transcript_16500:82-1233(+)
MVESPPQTRRRQPVSGGQSPTSPRHSFFPRTDAEAKSSPRRVITGATSAKDIEIKAEHEDNPKQGRPASSEGNDQIDATIRRSCTTLPLNKRQCLVVSAIMTGLFLNAGLNAGALSTLSIETGTFPGGEFVYKTLIKDYAASTGTLRTVMSDLDIVEGGTWSLKSETSETETVKFDTADLMYSVFLDDERIVPGGKTRFAAGALLQKSLLRGSPLNPTELKKTLLDMNDRKTEVEGAHSTETPYEVGNLPKVEAAVAQHPYTGGAWSAVLQSKKIVPRLRKHYEETNGVDGGGGVVVSTCSAKQRMCTFYMPLTKQDKFYMGKPSTAEYLERFESYNWHERFGINFDKVAGLTIFGISPAKVARGLGRMISFGGKGKGAGDEL